jgi:hypothetical protein
MTKSMTIQQWIKSRGMLSLWRVVKSVSEFGVVQKASVYGASVYRINSTEVFKIHDFLT